MTRILAGDNSLSPSSPFPGKPSSSFPGKKRSDFTSDSHTMYHSINLSPGASPDSFSSMTQYYTPMIQMSKLEHNSLETPALNSHMFTPEPTNSALALSSESTLEHLEIPGLNPSVKLLLLSKSF